MIRFITKQYNSAKSYVNLLTEESYDGIRSRFNLGFMALSLVLFIVSLYTNSFIMFAFSFGGGLLFGASEALFYENMRHFKKSEDDHALLCKRMQYVLNQTYFDPKQRLMELIYLKSRIFYARGRAQALIQEELPFQNLEVIVDGHIKRFLKILEETHKVNYDRMGSGPCTKPYMN